MKQLSFLLFFTLLSIVSISQDFEVAPVSMEFSVEPGNIDKKILYITNHSNKKQTFVLKLGEFVLDKEGKKMSKNSKDTIKNIKRSCVDWVSINPSLIELNPNERGQAEVIMTVPSGDYTTRWCRIYVQGETEKSNYEVDKNNLGAGLVTIPRIVVNITQSPLSNNNFRCAIDNLKEITTDIDSMRVFSADVTNRGDKVIKGYVHLTLANVQTAKEKRYKPKKVTVFPDATVTVRLAIPKDLPPGKYALAAIVDYAKGMPLEGTQIMIEQK